MNHERGYQAWESVRTERFIAGHDEWRSLATATSGHCVKCEATAEAKSPQGVTMKNGRRATKGVCPVCGTGMYRIGG